MCDFVVEKDCIKDNHMCWIFLVLYIVYGDKVAKAFYGLIGKGSSIYSYMEL